MALRLISEYPATTRPAFITLGKITKIGRNYSNDVILCSTREVAGIKGTVTPSSWISRSHAVIYEEPDGYYIWDCSSTGTYMDKTRLPKRKRVLLEDGVEIFFGVDSFKNRLPPKIGEKSKDISDFFFIFEKSAKPLKRKLVSQSCNIALLQMSNKRQKFRRSPLQVLNSKNVKKVEDWEFNQKNDADYSNCETQVACDIENYHTPSKTLSRAQLIKTQMRREREELPYQQTISTLRDMLKTEREEKVATVEHIQTTARQREADLNSKIKQLEEERKLREMEINEVRLAMAKQKAEATAEIARFNEKINQLQSAVNEKEKRNSDYMESIINKLTADHEKQIAEQSHRIRELELCRPGQAKKERVILQFGEQPNSQTRRCQISLDWTVGRLCELVHKKYLKKIPGNQMEIILHRTYKVMEQSKKLDSFDLRKGELLVIRKSFVLANPSNLSLRTEALCENLPNDVHIKRRSSLVPMTPLNSKKMNGHENLQSVINTCREDRQASYRKKLDHESCDLSPIMGQSKIRSYRDKMIKPTEKTKHPILDDEKDPSREPSVESVPIKTDMKLKSPKVIEEMEMEMEDEQYCAQNVLVSKPLPKKKKRQRRKSLKNSPSVESVPSKTDIKLKSPKVLEEIEMGDELYFPQNVQVSKPLPKKEKRRRRKSLKNPKLKLKT